MFLQSPICLGEFSVSDKEPKLSARWYALWVNVGRGGVLALLMGLFQPTSFLFSHTHCPCQKTD